MKKAIVIGSGIAGLASAIRLNSKGYQVDVFESNSYPGGKLTEFRLGNYRFDAGPSLFTMPILVDNLIRKLGEDPRDHFNYCKKEISCVYFWEDGTRFPAPAQPDLLAQKAEKTFGVEAQKITNYLRHSSRMYRLTNKVFLERSLHKASTYLSMDTVTAIVNIFGLHLSKTMHEVNQKQFDHPKLVQLFNRYATYNGSNPYEAPGILCMIPHLEFNVGTYFPKGGMHAITQSLFELAKNVGVTFQFNSPVEEILLQKNRASGVKVGGKQYPADVVVSNMDIVPTYRKLLPQLAAPEKTLKQERSSSALIFYWGIRKRFPQLDLHNIFFSDDYRKEFAAIFEEKNVLDDPTIYVNISSKEEPTDAPDGCENWFVMINVPSNTGQDWDEIIARSKENILKKLSRILGEDIRLLIEQEQLLEPRTIESKTSSYQGALYGASSNSKFSAFLRHPNFKNKVKGLYFCGGSVHPGGGIPLCLLSAQIVGDIVPSGK